MKRRSLCANWELIPCTRMNRLSPSSRWRKSVSAGSEFVTTSQKSASTYVQRKALVMLSTATRAVSASLFGFG